MSEENRQYDEERRGGRDYSEEKDGSRYENSRQERDNSRQASNEDMVERRREGGTEERREGMFNFDPAARGNGVSILVKNLNYRTDRDKLAEIFSEFGELSDVYIPLDYSTREPRGFAFCEFLKEDDALQAINAMDGQIIDDFNVTVARAERQRKKPEDYRRRDSRYGGRRGYDDRRGGGYRDRDDRRGRYSGGRRDGGNRYGRYEDHGYDRDDRRGGDRRHRDEDRRSPPRDRYYSGERATRRPSRDRDSSYDRYR